MKLSHLSETLIGSEIVRLGGEIREKMRQGDTIYNFTVGDFDPKIFPIPKELEDEIIEAYRQHYTNYPAAEGNLDLREAISQFLQEREGLNYTASEILVSCGGRPLIYSLFRVLADKGDKIIYAVPSWNNNHYTHFVEGTHVVVETRAENDFMPAAADLEPHIKGATLLCLCSPQNPTGTTISKSELEAICDMVLQENSRRADHEKKLYVMYDQMYWHLTYGGITHYNPVSLRPDMKPYTIFIDAISKIFAATGLRIGWAFGPAQVMHKMKEILGHIGAWGPMAEQKATARYLPQREKIDAFLHSFKTAIEERLHRIYEGFMELKKEGFPVDAIAPQAAIYLTIKIDPRSGPSKAADRFPNQAAVTSFILQEAHLAVVPFSAFGAAKDSPWYRLSVGTCRLEQIEEMFKELRAALQKCS